MGEFADMDYDADYCEVYNPFSVVPKVTRRTKNVGENTWDCTRFWKQANGDLIAYVDMGDRHLINTVRMCLRMNKDLALVQLFKELKRRNWTVPDKPLKMTPPDGWICDSESKFVGYAFIAS